MDLKGVLNEKDEDGQKEQSPKDDGAVRFTKNPYNYVI